MLFLTQDSIFWYVLMFFSTKFPIHLNVIFNGLDIIFGAFCRNIDGFRRSFWYFFDVIFDAFYMISTHFDAFWRFSTHYGVFRRISTQFRRFSTHFDAISTHFDAISRHNFWYNIRCSFDVFRCNFTYLDRPSTRFSNAFWRSNLTLFGGICICFLFDTLTFCSSFLFSFLFYWFIFSISYFLSSFSILFLFFFFLSVGI